MTATATAAPAAPLTKTDLLRLQREGKEVVVNHTKCFGIVYTIAAVNQTKAVLVAVTPGARNCNAHFSLIREHVPGQPVTPVSTVRPYLPPLAEGTIVRLKQPFRQWSTKDLFVVTGTRTRVTIQPLGGHGRGLYMPREGLEVIEVTSEQRTAIAALLGV